MGLLRVNVLTGQKWCQEEGVLWGLSMVLWVVLAFPRDHGKHRAILHKVEPRREWKGRVPLERDSVSCLEGHLNVCYSNRSPFWNSKDLSVKTSVSPIHPRAAYHEQVEGIVVEHLRREEAKLAFLKGIYLVIHHNESFFPHFFLPSHTCHHPLHPMSKLCLRDECDLACLCSSDFFVALFDWFF